MPTSSSMSLIWILRFRAQDESCIRRQGTYRPMGIYSKKIKSLNDIPEGAKIAIPNDPSNGGRALALLQSAKLLKLKDGVGVKATVGDIVGNDKKLKIVEIELLCCRVPWMIPICPLSTPTSLWS